MCCMNTSALPAREFSPMTGPAIHVYSATLAHSLLAARAAPHRRWQGPVRVLQAAIQVQERPLDAATDPLPDLRRLI